MPTCNIDILEAVLENPNFHQELSTNDYSQVIAMNIESGSSLGEQVYEGDAVLAIVEDCGEAVLNRKHSPVKMAAWSQCRQAHATTSSTRGAHRSSCSRFTPRRPTLGGHVNHRAGLLLDELLLRRV